MSEYETLGFARPRFWKSRRSLPQRIELVMVTVELAPCAMIIPPARPLVWLSAIVQALTVTVMGTGKYPLDANPPATFDAGFWQTFRAMRQLVTVSWAVSWLLIPPVRVTE